MRLLGLARSKALNSACLTFAYLLSALIYSHHAFAANEDSIIREDHNHPLILDLTGGLDLSGDVEAYESEFVGVDRSIIGRATNDQTLGNNAPGKLNLQSGDSTGQFWTFPNETLFGPKTPQTSGLPSLLAGQSALPAPRGPDERMLYISLTTCDQPTPKVPKPNGAPGQLELYVSTSSSNKEPDQKHNNYAVAIDGGFGWLNVSVKSDVYLGIFAPNNDEYTGIYSYQLTASIDAFYASLYNARNVFFIDSDTNSALLYTNNLTNQNSTSEVAQQWMNSSTKFSIYVQNQDDPSILGLQNSVCGLKNHAQIQGSAVTATMTMAGANPPEPKQQFYVKNLNGSSSYYAIVTIDGNSTVSKGGAVGGGGTVWNFADFATNFTTKSGTFSLHSTPVHPTYKPLQTATAPSSTTSPSATRSRTPSLLTPPTRTCPTSQPLGSTTTITPPPTTQTSSTPFSRSLATPPPLPNTL